MANAVMVSMAVEGPMDDAIATRLVVAVGAIPGSVFGLRGKGHLRKRVDGYNAAAVHAPWLVLVDLDDEHPCAPPLVNEWLPSPSAQLCFRVAVHESESWLLADRAAFATFLGVAVVRLPQDPDALPRPKEFVVSLARRSRRRVILDDLVPPPEGGRAVGPAYGARLAEFVRKQWDPARASARSQSLLRAIECLKTLASS